MADLSDVIMQTLSVVPSAPIGHAVSGTPKSKIGWAPPRPEPKYEYRIAVSRSEYGYCYIVATSAEEAYDNAEYDDIQWEDSGDVDWGGADAEKVNKTPDNEDEIDEWESKYGNRFDSDGEPLCSECRNLYPAAELTSEENEDHWYCTECLHQLTQS